MWIILQYLKNIVIKLPEIGQQNHKEFKIPNFPMVSPCDWSVFIFLFFRLSHYLSLQPPSHAGLIFSPVSVSSSCHNKIPHRLAGLENGMHFSEFWRLEAQGQGVGLCGSWWELPSQRADDCTLAWLPSVCAQGEREWPLLVIPPVWADKVSILMTSFNFHCLLKPLSPNTIPLEVRAIVYELGGVDTI